MQEAVKFPFEGDLVVVTIRKINQFNAEADLDEYSGVTGFIAISEVANGWVKYIRDFLRENQKTVCKVLSVDRKSKVVELSYKRVNDHQRREKISEWKNDQKATKLMEIVAENLKKPYEECMDEFGNMLIQRFGTLYAAFEEASAEGEDFLKGTRSKWKNVFIKIAKQNVTSPYVKIGGMMELYSLDRDGVEKIKKALTSAIVDGITITYAGAPKYRISVRDTEYKSAEEKLKKAIASIQEECKKQSIYFEFKREEIK